MVFWAILVILVIFGGGGFLPLSLTYNRAKFEDAQVLDDRLDDAQAQAQARLGA